MFYGIKTQTTGKKGTPTYTERPYKLVVAETEADLATLRSGFKGVLDVRRLESREWKPTGEQTEVALTIDADYLVRAFNYGHDLLGRSSGKDTDTARRNRTDAWVLQEATKDLQWLKDYAAAKQGGKDGFAKFLDDVYMEHEAEIEGRA